MWGCAHIHVHIKQDMFAAALCSTTFINVASPLLSSPLLSSPLLSSPLLSSPLLSSPLLSSPPPLLSSFIRFIEGNQDAAPFKACPL